MISYKHKFIFLHIPKCGGSSLNSILSEYSPRGRNIHHLLGHPGLNGYLSHLREHNLKAADYTIFSFVRNPYSRLVSAYFFLKEGGHAGPAGRRLAEVLNLKELSFREFVKKHISGKELGHQWTPFFIFVNDKNIKSIDFIGRFENLQEDFNIVCDKIGIPQQQVPHYRQTKHKHYTEYYDDETRKIVAEMYGKDIQYFGYKFGE